MFSCTGSVLDSIWHLLIELDLRERVLARMSQKMNLARYARQPLDTWDTRFVFEIDHAMNALEELMKGEEASIPKPEDT